MFKVIFLAIPLLLVLKPIQAMAFGIGNVIQPAKQLFARLVQ
jgi:hypothetical protein